MRQHSQFLWGSAFCVMGLLAGVVAGCDTEKSYDEAGEAIEEGANKVQKRIEAANEDTPEVQQRVEATSEDSPE